MSRLAGAISYNEWGCWRILKQSSNHGWGTSPMIGIGISSKRLGLSQPDYSATVSWRMRSGSQPVCSRLPSTPTAAYPSCSAASAGTSFRARSLSYGTLTPGMGGDHTDPVGAEPDGV